MESRSSLSIYHPIGKIKIPMPSPTHTIILQQVKIFRRNKTTYSFSTVDATIADIADSASSSSGVSGTGTGTGTPSRSAASRREQDMNDAACVLEGGVSPARASSSSASAAAAGGGAGGNAHSSSSSSSSGIPAQGASPERQQRTGRAGANSFVFPPWPHNEPAANDRPQGQNADQQAPREHDDISETSYADRRRQQGNLQGDAYDQGQRRGIYDYLKLAYTAQKTEKIVNVYGVS
jgi:hypothetical protein